MNSFIYIQFEETNVDAAHDYLFIFFNFEWFYTLNKNFIRSNSILNDVRDKLEKYFSFYNYYDSIFERIAPWFVREKIAKGDKLFSETRVMVHVDNRNSIVRE